MNFRTTISIILSLPVAISLLGQPVYADILILKNGDRITGEIKKIWDAEVTIEPSYTDEFTVDMPAVDHIESDRDFEIELADGTKILGKLTGSDADGNQLLTIGDESLSVPLASLLELDEPEEAYEWDSNIDLSASVNRGNTDSSTGRLTAHTTLKLSDHRHIGDLTFSREFQSRVSTQERDQLVYNYNWIFRDPTFFAYTFSYERDPIIELEQRIIVSAGLGRDLLNKPRKALSVQLGLGRQTESIATIRTESTVVTWSMRYRHDFFGDDLELYHNNSITHNLSGRTNTSIKTTTGMRLDITDLLYANISLDYDYETDPIDTASNEDIVLLLGGGIEF